MVSHIRDIIFQHLFPAIELEEHRAFERHVQSVQTDFANKEREEAMTIERQKFDSTHHEEEVAMPPAKAQARDTIAYSIITQHDSDEKVSLKIEAAAQVNQNKEHVLIAG